MSTSEGYRSRNRSPVDRDRYRQNRRWDYYTSRRRRSPSYDRWRRRKSWDRYERRRSRSRSRNRERERGNVQSSTSRAVKNTDEEKSGMSHALEKALSAARKAELAIGVGERQSNDSIFLPSDSNDKNTSAEKRSQMNFSNPPNLTATTHIEAPSSTTSSAVPIVNEKYREVDSEIDQVRLTDSTKMILSKRFWMLEEASGEGVNLRDTLSKSEVSLEDISVVIDRNLPLPITDPLIRMSYIPEIDVFCMPRSLTEGNRAIFDRPEIKAFKHDELLHEDEYVETRKVVRRDPDAHSNRADLINRSQNSGVSTDRNERDIRMRIRPTHRSSANDSSRGRGRFTKQRGIMARIGGFERSSSDRNSRRIRGRRDHYHEMKRDDCEPELPDFSQRPNKGYLRPECRNPTDIPRHGSYYLHDDREEAPISFRGGRSFRYPRVSRYSIIRNPSSHLNNKFTRRGSKGISRREPKQRSDDLDMWKHDKFEEVEETFKDDTKK